MNSKKVKLSIGQAYIIDKMMNGYTLLFVNSKNDADHKFYLKNTIERDIPVHGKSAKKLISIGFFEVLPNTGKNVEYKLEKSHYD